MLKGVCPNFFHFCNVKDANTREEWKHCVCTRGQRGNLSKSPPSVTSTVRSWQMYSMCNKSKYYQQTVNCAFVNIMNNMPGNKIRIKQIFADTQKK